MHAQLERRAVLVAGREVGREENLRGGEVGEQLDLPQHVLRFWETRFSQIKPMKRGGGRRYYRPQDVELIKGIRHMLYDQGYTIKGVQKLLREGGGMHNPFLIGKLTDYFDPVPVRTVEDYGVNSDAKEALCFAVLAHEAINGVPTSMPSVTGAFRATLLGKICVPL